MKAIAIAVGTLATVVAPAVLAQDNFPYDPTTVQRQQQLEQRYGPYSVPQDRAHLSNPNNRPWYEEPSTDGRYTHPDGYGFGYGYGHGNAYGFQRDYRRDRREGMECWNPRARHYEEVRSGERQDDLDFTRCRSQRFR
jgi:hypothetical protein